MDVVSGLASVLQPNHFLYLMVGVCIGLVFGTIPGLSGITAVALLFPFSFVLGPEAAIIMMIGVYVATCTAGALAGTLFNMPGDVMGAATARDGYPLTQKGEAGRAISVAVTASSVGGILGTLLLILIAPNVARVALNFGAPEYFALALLGMVCVASLSTGSLLKALIAGTFGLLLGTVGTDPILGSTRFVMGMPQLQGGIDFVPAIIGFFALSEILVTLFGGSQMGKYTGKDVAQVARFARPSAADFKRIRFTVLRQSIIGTFMGILPGAGSTIAAFLGYGTEAQFVKDKSQFGKGDVRGVAAPESANSAAAAGSMVPLLTLGMPGGAVTAIMLAVFVMNNIQPGPRMLVGNGEGSAIMGSVFGALLIACLVTLLVGLFLVRYLMRLLTVPYEIFSTVVLVFAVVGAFSIFNRIADVWIMIFCGIVGFFAKKYGYPIAAIILGLVLGGIAERNLINGIGVSRGDWLVMVTRPATMVVLIAALLLLAVPIIWWQVGRRQKRKAESVSETEDADA